MCNEISEVYLKHAFNLLDMSTDEFIPIENLQKVLCASF